MKKCDYYFERDDSGKRMDELFKRQVMSYEDTAIRKIQQFSDEIITFHKDRAYVFIELHETVSRLKDACDEYLKNRLENDPDDVIFDEWGWTYKIIHTDNSDSKYKRVNKYGNPDNNS